MPLIAVDIGNTSIKVGLYTPWPDPFDFGTFSIPTSPPEDWWMLAKLLPQREAMWLVGSVHREAESRLCKWVAENRPQDRYRKLVNAELPIRVDVQFPERLGTDRLLAAIAANELRNPNQPAIVIDAGTAVTVDLVTADGVFQGGIIWPGRQIMAEALASKTDALPLVTTPWDSTPPSVVGKSTEQAIRSGLFWGSVGAIREFVAQISVYADTQPQIFLSGGAAESMALYACPTARRVDDLVLSGIKIVARKLLP